MRCVSSLRTATPTPTPHASVPRCPFPSHVVRHPTRRKVGRPFLPKTGPILLELARNIRFTSTQPLYSSVVTVKYGAGNHVRHSRAAPPTRTHLLPCEPVIHWGEDRLLSSTLSPPSLGWRLTPTHMDLRKRPSHPTSHEADMSSDKHGVRLDFTTRPLCKHGSRKEGKMLA
ncbi:hypothetical protein EYF80_048697 [Liparis tanakae]|uniref:Uncharacterized protein n=1 Tax=Liparis tanakae TaxID=230148 RepID=A0A4Z2FJI6_9TELE|nr:hypothetical protein EYF80_048697 [Liparis tanakae]